MGRHARPTQFGRATYREGALERLGDASALLRAERFAGSVYLAGRGVEGMLRAVVWTLDPEPRVGGQEFEAGHDLRRLLTKLRELGLLKVAERDDEFAGRVQRVGRLWFNNARFVSSRVLSARWREIGVITKRQSLKQAAKDFYEDCSAIMRRAEVLWQRRS